MENLPTDLSRARHGAPTRAAASAAGTARSLSSRCLALVLSPLLALALTGCAGALNAITSGAGYSVVKDIRYKAGARGTYDLYVPDEVRADSPVVVFVYGGSWDSGEKGMYLFVGQSLASQGIVVAIPDYRIYPQVKFPGFVEDAAEATGRIVASVRAGGDGVPAGNHPIFLMGHSAGAEIVGLLATDERWLSRQGVSPRRLAGFIGLAGPYNFLPLSEERYKRIFPEATRRQSQPINYVDGREAPMLLIAGADDTTVNPDNTTSMAAKVRAAGGRVTDEIVPGVDHVGAITAFATALDLSDRSIRRTVLDFIARRSRKAGTDKDLRP